MVNKRIISKKNPQVNSILEADVWFKPFIVLEVLGVEVTLSPIHTYAMGSIRKKKRAHCTFSTIPRKLQSWQSSWRCYESKGNCWNVHLAIEKSRLVFVPQNHWILCDLARTTELWDFRMYFGRFGLSVDRRTIAVIFKESSNGVFDKLRTTRVCAFFVLYNLIDYPCQNSRNMDCSVLPFVFLFHTDQIQSWCTRLFYSIKPI